MKIFLILFIAALVLLLFIFSSKNYCQSKTVIPAGKEIGGLTFTQDITYDELAQFGIVYGPVSPSCK